MNAERWTKVKALFDAVVDLDPDSRERFLERSASDADLRLDVERLLSSHESAESFLEHPAANQVASVILEPKGMLHAGDRFAHYKILRQIGAGGMGEVYLAEDEKLGRRVAVKILNERFGKNDSHLQRFIREAKAASSLNHPNILVIHEISIGDEANYIVSEFVEGKTLRDMVDASGMTLKSALDVSVQIAEALAAAHGAGIVHRDIKPENIVVRPDGYVKVLDFGLAKLLSPENQFIGAEQDTVQHNRTAQGVIMGTVNYMSPEQAKGQAVDQRTDIFSLGVIMYELLTGSNPFAGDSMAETFANLVNAESPPPIASANIPAEFRRIVSKMLRKDRNDRYQTASELIADLKTFRDNITLDERFGTLQATKALTTSQLRHTDESNPAPNDTARVNTGRSNVMKLLLAIGLVLIVGVVAGISYYMSQTGPSGSSDGRRSVAVLPFTNATNDANAEYLAEGVTESIINNLSQLSGLKVMSRNSSFRFKNNLGDTREIAARLNVDSLVTGDIKQLGDKLVINVRLINGSDETQIWGNQYVRSLTDVIAAQNEIATAVAQNLKVQLSPTDTKLLNKRYTDNAEAYQLYMRGRFHVFKLTPGEIQQGILYFEQAIALDPNYALAYAGLSDAHRSLAIGSEIEPAVSFARSKASALRAIEIDDSLSNGHTALGTTLFWADYDWKGAESEYKRALELNANDTNAHLFYAHFLSNVGRHVEALAEVQRARELDPLFPFAGALEGQFLLHAGKADEALVRLQRTFELAPNFWMPHLFAASAYTEKGMFADAVVEARKARELTSASTTSIAYESYALAKSGRRDEAQSALDELLNISKTRYMPPTHIALAYNGLGDTEQALSWLEKGFAERDAKMVFLKVEPKWNNLRSEPRFVELMKRMNFDE